METSELRELLLGRLYIEEQLFRDSMLHRDKKTIMEEAYKIETFANLYEILAEQMEQLSEETLRKLLYMNYSILEWLYQKWLKMDDSAFDELKAYVDSELAGKAVVAEHSCRKDNAYGERNNTAA